MNTLRSYCLIINFHKLRLRFKYCRVERGCRLNRAIRLPDSMGTESESLSGSAIVWPAIPDQLVRICSPRKVMAAPSFRLFLFLRNLLYVLWVWRLPSEPAPFLHIRFYVFRHKYTDVHMHTEHEKNIFNPYGMKLHSFAQIVLFM